jgi:protein XagA
MKKTTHANPFTTLFALLLFLGDPSVSTAQAWTKAKNSGFYKLDFSRISAANVFNTKSEVIPFRSITNNITSFYGEYGVSNKFTLIGYVPFLINNQLGELKNTAGAVFLPSTSETNFGDVDLGFRYQLYNKNGISLSANLLLGLPTGNSTQKDGLLTGDGEFNQLLKLAIGTGKARWWTQGAVGFNNRTKDFSDEFRYDFEFGYKFFNDRLLTILKLNGIESLDNGTAKENIVGVFSNNVEFAGVGPEVLYYVNNKKNVGVSLRIAGSLKGRNILAAPSIAVGVFAQF